MTGLHTCVCKVLGSLGDSQLRQATIELLDKLVGENKKDRLIPTQLHQLKALVKDRFKKHMVDYRYLFVSLDYIYHHRIRTANVLQRRGG